MAKIELLFDPAVMNAAGTLGFAPDMHTPVDWDRLGAFVTNPVSLAQRTPAHGERFAAYPGGFLLHTGFPNPGLSTVLRWYARRWSRSKRPVIVHLLALGVEDLTRMVRQLEVVEGVSGLEVGVTSDIATEELTALTRAASGELPVILRLPLERAAELAHAAIQAGADAVSLAAPRGAHPAAAGEIIQGRLYGAGVFPLALKTVQDLAKLRIPVIGAGGVYTLEQRQAMLSAGALAVQLDGVLWRNCGMA